MPDFLFDGENGWSETNEGVKLADVVLVDHSKTNAFVKQV